MNTDVPPPAGAPGNHRLAWALGGGCGTLLILAACGLYAALMYPAVSYQPPAPGPGAATVTATATPEELREQAAAPLPVTASPLPALQRGKRYQFIDTARIRAQFTAQDFAAIDAYYQQQLTTRLDYDSRYNLGQVVLQLGYNRSGTERRLRAWAAAMPQSHLPHLLLGRWHIKKAWQARGSGWASTVTDSGRQIYYEHLSAADRELRAAYDLNPADPNIGAQGVIVAMGLSTDVEDDWFARAMAADPYHSMAYSYLLNARYPKWGGTWELARAAVDEALDKTDSNPQLFQTLTAWHGEYNKRMAEGDSVARHAAFLEGYRDELRAAYARAAQRYPDEFVIHICYANDALEAEETEVALREFAHIISRWERGAAMLNPYETNHDNELQDQLATYAWLLATTKDNRWYDPARALVYAKKAVAIFPNRHRALNTLARAYAANGDFTRAIATQREAMQKYDNAAFRAESRETIARYERREAPRE